MNEKTMEQSQETLFEDVLSTSEYDKKVKSAQSTIYIVAIIELVFGIVAAFRGDEKSITTTLVTYAVIGILFFLLGLWCSKSPFTAILIAIIIYSLLFLLDVIYEPTSAFTGIIVKIFIVVYLIKGLLAAREAQVLKKILEP